MTLHILTDSQRESDHKSSCNSDPVCCVGFQPQDQDVKILSWEQFYSGFWWSAAHRDQNSRTSVIVTNRLNHFLTVQHDLITGSQEAGSVPLVPRIQSPCGVYFSFDAPTRDILTCHVITSLCLMHRSSHCTGLEHFVSFCYGLLIFYVLLCSKSRSSGGLCCYAFGCG